MLPLGQKENRIDLRTQVGASMRFASVKSADQHVAQIESDGQMCCGGFVTCLLGGARLHSPECPVLQVTNPDRPRGASWES